MLPAKIRRTERKKLSGMSILLRAIRLFLGGTHFTQTELRRSAPRGLRPSTILRESAHSTVAAMQATGVRRLLIFSAAMGIDAESAFHPQTLLCYEMNGMPLAPEHGAPLRLVIPVKYGIKNLKRIGTIHFTDERPADYWAERGYDWYVGH
jgi:hypothetical protein